MRLARVAAVLAVISALVPALLEPRPALLRWAWDTAPWILLGAVGWAVVALWILRGIATLFLRTPGRRLNEALGEDPRA